MNNVITIHLECSVCKNRNYRFKRGKEKRSDKIEVKKFCKYCKQHTVHNQVR
ncbi:50S ribosomal protein L33 [bacterium]|nr:50S ribosomal protein L33 [bacterium]